MTDFDPYLARGLKRNPFIVEDEPVIPEDLWLARDFPPTPQPGQGRLIQIIGPPGTGKSSLLFHWRQRMPGPYRHYPPGIGRFRVPPVASIAYWDEVDRIPAPLLNFALRRAGRISATLICGTHEDLTRSAARRGFTVETVEPPPISAGELIAWADLRILRMQLNPGQPPPIRLAPEEAASIVKQAGHSWRIAADLLHIWMARAVGQPVTDPRPESTRGGRMLNRE